MLMASSDTHLSPNHHPISSLPLPRKPHGHGQRYTDTDADTRVIGNPCSTTSSRATQQDTANSNTGGQPFCRHPHISLISSVAALPLVGTSARRTLGGLEHARYLIRDQQKVTEGFPHIREHPLLSLSLSRSPVSTFPSDSPLGSIQGGAKKTKQKSPSTRKSLKGEEGAVAAHKS